ncbi:MAG TPA: hypothetical protein VFG73_07405 [Rhodanobacteraceae bacterium]|nr:hypothetical protein [Rhodanobacteraceae bacterium]
MHTPQLLGVMAALAVASSVQPPPDSGRPLTLQQAVDQVQADSGGRVLAADTVRSRRGGKYRIKILTADGRVRVVEVDSHRGRTPVLTNAKLNSKEKH